MAEDKIVIPELLLPAGSLSKLKAAIDYGADAVYAGVAGYSMRPDGAALNISEFAEAAEYVHARGKKIYAALNIMAFNEDLKEIRAWLRDIRDVAVDALIVGDAGVFRLARQERPDLPVHISTQMGVANTESALFWKEAGADRVILAREATLAAAKEIKQGADMEVEIFVHGAMCVAISGRCLLSAFLTGKSGSRGECKHACRWEYQLVESTRPGESIPIFEEGRGTVMLGSKDLCLIGHIPELAASGVSSIKVEGRMKSEYYVAVVARVYRDALDLYKKDPDNYVFQDKWLEELDAVSHRPYDTGFAFGYSEDEPDRLQAENIYAMTRELAGIVEEGNRIFVKNPFREGDVLEWIAPDWQGGEVVVSRVRSESGAEWECARPAEYASVEFEGGFFPPVGAMLRSKKGKEFIRGRSRKSGSV